MNYEVKTSEPNEKNNFIGFIIKKRATSRTGSEREEKIKKIFSMVKFPLAKVPRKNGIIILKIIFMDLLSSSHLRALIVKNNAEVFLFMAHY